MYAAFLIVLTVFFLLTEGQAADTTQKRRYNPLFPVPTKTGKVAAFPSQQKPALEEDLCSASCQKKMKLSPILVLSIDGASVRGVGQFKLLQAIEDQVSKKLTTIGIEANRSMPQTISEIFDFYAGTSAGSLNVGSILIPDNPDAANLPGQTAKSKFSLEKLYQQLPGTLAAAFSTSPFRKVRTLGGLLGSKYTAKDLQRLLQEMSGLTRMSDLVKPAIITSYDLRNRQIMNFSTYEACRPKKDVDEAVRMMPDEKGHLIKDSNVYLWQAMRASSAAPTYYKPLEMKIGGKDRALIDAGLFVMSPALLASQEVKKLYPCRRIVMISISSGDLVNNVRQVKTKGPTAGSIPAVLEATIETAIEGQQLLTDEMMKNLGITYHRLSFDVNSKTFDDFSKQNIQSLERTAEIAINEDNFKEAIQAIVDVHRQRLTDPEPTVFTCAAKEKDVQKEQIAQNYKQQLGKSYARAEKPAARTRR